MPDIYLTMWQVIGESMGEAYLRLKLKDQKRALAMIDEDPELRGLHKISAPFLDLEVRGVPALRYFGGIVWNTHDGDTGRLADMTAGVAL
jgi:hypothetical protein